DRVGALEPEDRYPDASTMRAAIADAGDALPPPGPLHLAGMSDRVDPHPTRAVPPAAVASAAAAAANAAPPMPTAPPVMPTETAPLSAAAPVPPATGALFDQDAIEIIPDPPPTIVVDTVATTKAEPNHHRRWVPFVVATVIVVTLALAAFF